MRKWKRAKKRRPDPLVKMLADDWPLAKPGKQRDVRVEVWASRTLLVQIYEGAGWSRIAIFQVERGRLHRELTWSDLQAIKRAVGHGQTPAVEYFPPDEEIVNVENLRHLWLLSKPPHFAWRTTREET